MKNKHYPMENHLRLFVPVGVEEDLKEMLFQHYGKEDDNLLARYLYVIHYLYWYRTTHKDTYEREGVCINAERFYQKIGRRHKATIFRNLEEWGLIEKCKQYKVGENSMHFLLNEVLLATPFCIRTLTEKESSIVKMVRQSNATQERFLVKQLDILKNHVSLSKEGLAFIAAKYPSEEVKELIANYGREEGRINELLTRVEIDADDLMLFCFLIKDFFTPTRPHKNSRIYTSLSSLKSEYRQFLLIDGKPVMQTDIVNSQIAFSVPVIKNYLRKKAGVKDYQFPEDVLLYERLACDKGNIYEYLSNEGLDMELNEENRKWFKQTFFKDGYFSRVPDKRKRKLQKAFDQVFSTVYQAINGIKTMHPDMEKPYAAFAMKLQETEASVVLWVLKKLQQQGIPALSIHDSIVVNDVAHLQLAEQLIRERMKKEYDIQCTFKRELAKAKPVSTQRQVNENMAWFQKEFEGLEVSNYMVKLPHCTIYVPSLKVQYHKGIKKYPFKREGLKKLITEQLNQQRDA